MLIIYAHPNHDGHCGYILKQLKKQLDFRNIRYRVLDLYKLEYDPVLKQEEHYVSGHHHITEETKRYQELLKKARCTAIIYPTWWNGTPAILKGFFDRTLIHGFAFSYNEKGIPQGHLRGRVAVITTTGGPLWAEKLLMGDRSLKTVTKDTLGFCGFKAQGFMVDRATRLTVESRNKIQRKVTLAVNYLFE